MVKILFLCASDAACGPMAAALVNARASETIQAQSAGISSAAAVHPLAVQAMAEIGIDISGYRPRPWPEALRGIGEADIVITLCQEAAERCSFLLPGQPAQVNWNLANPALGAGADHERLAAFRACRDELRRLIDDLLCRGYLQALAWAKNQANLILENLAEGIIAHDLQRRIVYFNSAAEAITGFQRREVLGQDCHEIFPAGFCGSDCVFGDTAKSAPALESMRYPVSFVNRSGERRDLEMSLRAIRRSDGEMVGVLASFRDLTREHALATRLEEVESFSGIITRDKRMREIFDLVRSAAETNASVLIIGESGTGKELVAAALHRASPRANHRFVAVNCGALPDTLLESELFGHAKGAFTGALREKMGRFELADGGTIFLDEIGDISPAMQAKLLRVLQEGTFERLGELITRKVDVRVVSATNKDLQAEIAAGRFRQDLFYRLCVVPIHLPPLRERVCDIPLLAEHFLRRAAAEAGRQPPRLSPRALDALLAHSWPGNVRELQNALQFAMVKQRGDVIDVHDLPPALQKAARPAAAPGGETLAGKRGRPAKLTAAEVEEALRLCRGDRASAARRLGVGRATLYRYLQRLRSPA
ncbi:MAG: sigma 54-interacting transcriptional regulator, partial [Planctomycetota bacterium]|nr:sigma 54-interacting transcriptional regulator [Planctomycetota bacterium]